MNHRHLIPALLAAAILAGACANSNDGGSTAERASTIKPTTTSTTEMTTTNNTSTSIDASSTPSPARLQLDWVVNVLNDGKLTAGDAEERFSPTFLAQVPVDQIAASIPQVVGFAEPPYTVERFEASGNGLSGEAVLLGTDGGRLSVQISVAGSSPNLIEGLGIVPTELEFPVPVSVEAIDKRLEALGPQSSLGVYDVANGRCEAIHEIRTDSTIVLGSVFKLWVLAALGHEIDASRASWDETVAVTDELRSNPVGEIYELETGTQVTLRRLAEAMISTSDNTATYLLIDRLGRPTVEAAMDRAGVTDPAANVPLLSTGNLFALKYVADGPNASDYRALDQTGRQALLDKLDRAKLPWVGAETGVAELLKSTNADGLPIDQPRDLDIEWFATAEDLCRTLVHLSELADTPGLEPVAPILELNPGDGLPFNRDRWPTIRFKGGSESGVVAGAWWFEGPDGGRYVVAGGVTNPDAAIDELDAVLTLASSIELID